MLKAKNRLSLIGVLACLLAACSTMTPPPRGIDLAAVEAQAESAAQSGDTQRAAALYAQLADATSGFARSDFLIESARQSIAGGDAVSARQRLEAARVGAGGEQQQAILVLLAGLEVDAGRPQAALDMLASAPQRTSLVAQRDGAAVRGRALFALRRYAEAVRALVGREVWLNSSDEVLANQRMIWDGFRNNPPRPGEASPTTGDSVVDGWLALGSIAGVEQTETEQRAALLGWREVYRTHPGTGLLSAMLSTGRSGDFPRQIALLLPVNSTNADFRFPAEAIRDSFLLAYWADTGRPPTTVRVYDTAVSGSASAFQLAQAEGAELVVGPLLRGDVEAILPLAGTVPTLALNVLPADTPLPPNFYQFALAPEDEARAAARRAIADGARTAVALVPIDAVSDRPIRILTAFRDEFEAHGGRLLESYRYEPLARNYSPEIIDLFNINDSTRRHNALTAALGNIPIEFVPRPRRDVDAIFISADPGPGRTLRAELAANAISVPIYSTADIYRDPTAGPDTDLNDIVFADMPLVIAPGDDAARLRRQIEQFWPERDGQVRFFGMGFDAYNLVRMLFSGGIQAGPLEGMSGDLRLDGYGRVWRDLPSARFSRGRPVQLEPAPQPADSQLLGTRR